MSFFKHLGKHAARFQFDILIQEISDFFIDSDSSNTYYVTIERGSKRFRTLPTSPAAAKLRFFQILSFGCTLYREKEKTQYSKKVFTFQVKSTDTTKRYGLKVKKVNYFANVNLSAFATRGVRHATLPIELIGRNLNVNELMEESHLPERQARLKEKQQAPPKLLLSVRCRWVNDMSRDESGYTSCSSDSSRTSVDVSSMHSISSVAATHEFFDAPTPPFPMPAAALSLANPNGNGNTANSIAEEDEKQTPANITASANSTTAMNGNATAHSTPMMNLPMAISTPQAQAALLAAAALKNRTMPSAAFSSAVLANSSPEDSPYTQLDPSDIGAAVSAALLSTGLTAQMSSVGLSAIHAAAAGVSPGSSLTVPSANSQSAVSLNVRLSSSHGSVISTSLTPAAVSPYDRLDDTIASTPLDPANAVPAVHASVSSASNSAALLNSLPILSPSVHSIVVHNNSPPTSHTPRFGFNGRQSSSSTITHESDDFIKSLADSLAFNINKLSPTVASVGTITFASEQLSPALQPVATNASINTLSLFPTAISPANCGAESSSPTVRQPTTSSNSGQSLPAVQRPSSLSSAAKLRPRPRSSSMFAVLTADSSPTNSSSALLTATKSRRPPSASGHSSATPTRVQVSLLKAAQTAAANPIEEESYLDVQNENLEKKKSESREDDERKFNSIDSSSNAVQSGNDSSLQNHADGTDKQGNSQQGNTLAVGGAAALDLRRHRSEGDKGKVGFAVHVTTANNTAVERSTSNDEQTLKSSNSPLHRAAHLNAGNLLDEKERDSVGNHSLQAGKPKIRRRAQSPKASPTSSGHNAAGFTSFMMNIASHAGSTIHFVSYSALRNVTRFKEGHFGIVYRAEWSPPPNFVLPVSASRSIPRSQQLSLSIPVVIKVPKRRPGSDEWSELFSFVQLPPHAHVLPFLGICRDFAGLRFSAFCLVTALQPQSLKEKLTEVPDEMPIVFDGAQKMEIEKAGQNADSATSDSANRSIPAEAQTQPALSPLALPLQSSSKYAIAANTLVPSLFAVRCMSDMAEGVCHLHSFGIVHRDIALRNFLVSEDARILVCDFGLSRKVPDSAHQSYYQIENQGLLPIRWMSPESLLTHRFTRMSDVWMYGCSVWEMLTGGKSQPYERLPHVNQVIAGVCTGLLRPDLSPLKPSKLRVLLESCFQMNPQERPTMEQIARTLKDILRDEYHQVEERHTPQLTPSHTPPATSASASTSVSTAPSPALLSTPLATTLLFPMSSSFTSMLPNSASSAALATAASSAAVGAAESSM